MRIFIDIDDCLNNLKEIFVQKAVDLGYIEEYREIKHWNLRKFFIENPPLSEQEIIERINNIFLSSNFWLNLPVKKDAIETVKWLNDTHEIYLITAPWHPDPDCMKYKIQWVEKYFPFLKYNQLNFVFDKWLLDGDLIIDDKPITIEKFKGITIIFDQPYNQNVKASYRVIERENDTAWNQVFRIINDNYTFSQCWQGCFPSMGGNNVGLF